ncbi:hypothetical protein HMPREF1487_07741 [Pseudomonas sp. HPB0071]|uniref:Uncharacterized protein n=3 Tax=Pseudomonas TaxID=286 RepID=A0A2X2CUT8_PSELU|nr:hypothetical protein HMPREF1487_07741 [Pseudomonas sp. HPB0071]SHI70285.1 hypothetical protein SAMN05216295_10322 [Pseudomonas zeshuii]SPZ09436.1 Uncharacterised protein [Pseudomonas luteola]
MLTDNEQGFSARGMAFIQLKYASVTSFADLIIFTVPCSNQMARLHTFSISSREYLAMTRILLALIISLILASPYVRGLRPLPKAIHP